MMTQVVKSVSGTWHITQGGTLFEKRPYEVASKCVTMCDRIVKVSKYTEVESYRDLPRIRPEKQYREHYPDGFLPKICTMCPWESEGLDYTHE